MKNRSLLLVDAVGLTVVVLLAAVGVWCGLVDAGQAGRQIAELKTAVQQLQENRERLRGTLQRQEETLHKRQTAFGERDLLPESTPVEREFSTVTALAIRNGLEVSGFTPQGSTEYPGIHENRFLMRAQGSFAGYLAFLHEFQISKSWADMTYLSLTPGKGLPGEKTTGELTLSLYSATAEQAAEEDEDA